ncbi:hypothetical protein B0H11DRAFT_1951348 [Mycena galericulata]|nr:hypothetical protein B0H11DRAFT_1951348 [Mycena galericulata]
MQNTEISSRMRSPQFLGVIGIFLFTYFTLCVLFRSAVQRLRPSSNISFYSVHREDGYMHAPLAPEGRFRFAQRLGVDCFKSLRTNLRLQQIMYEILHRMAGSLYSPGRQSLDRIKQWPSWVASSPLRVVFHPYINQPWGCVKVVEARNNFTIRVLLDLAELTDETRPSYHLSVDHFRFCFVTTIFQQAANLLMEFVSPHAATSQIPGSTLYFGDAGEDFEHQMLGGKLVCEWDRGHVADLGHLRCLYIRDFANGQDYPLDSADIKSFLDKIENPTPLTSFAIDLSGKEASIAQADRVRTYTKEDMGKTTGEIWEVSGGRVRTGPMLGFGRCYDRSSFK